MAARCCARVLWTALLLIITASFPSFAEDVTITTYYPSPYGSYKQLSVEDGGTEVSPYGSLQIIREAAGHLGSHVAFIRDGTSRTGLGYKQSSNIFGFGPGVTGAAFDPTHLAMDSSGNVGIGTTTLQTVAPGGGASGNLTVNDIYVSSTASWVSQAAAGTEGTLVVKTEDEARADKSAYEDDSALKFMAGPNETRQFEFVILFFEDAATDIKFQLTGPSLTGGGWCYGTAVATLTPDSDGSFGVPSKTLQAFTYDNYANAAYSFNYTASAYGLLIIYGTIKTANAGGNVTLQWAQRVAGSAAAVVHKGSYVKAKKI